LIRVILPLVRVFHSPRLFEWLSQFFKVFFSFFVFVFAFPLSNR